MRFLILILVGILIYLSGLLSTKFYKNEKFLNFSVSLFFGTALGLVFINLVPNSFKILKDDIGTIRSVLAIIILIFIGIFALKILYLLIPRSKKKTNKNNLFHTGLILIVVIIFFNVASGVNIYLESLKNLKYSIFLSMGMALCNIPMGFAISSMLSKLNCTKNKICNICLGISLSALLGGLVMFLFQSENHMLRGVLFGISLGMFIYIIKDFLIDQIKNIKDKKTLKLGIIFGILLVITSKLFELI